LTDVAILAAKPKAKPFRISGQIQGLPGSLVVVVRARKDESAESSKTRKKSVPAYKDIYYRYRLAGQDVMIALGRYASRGAPHGLTLAEATGKARELAAKAVKHPRLKEHLADEKRAQEEAQRQQQRHAKAAGEKTFERLLDAYVGHLRASGKQSAQDVETLFRLHVKEPFPDLLTTPAASIDKYSVANIGRRLVEQGKQRTAGKFRAYVSAAFQMALTAGTSFTSPTDEAGYAIDFGLTVNPVAATKAFTGVTSRDRILNDHELRHLMQRAEAIKSDVTRDALALLMLLGGQRIVQLLRVKTNEVDLKARTIMQIDLKGRAKEGRPRRRIHVLPLTDAALAIVERRVNLAKALGVDFVFTTGADTHLNPRTISKEVTAISTAMVAAGESDKRFQLRDFRRTAESCLVGDLGFTKDVTAQVLSHGIGGVQDTHYLKHPFTQQKLLVLRAWESKLQSVRTGEPPPSNVRELKRA